MHIVEHGAPEPYGDSAAPKRLGTVSPLDPEFFSSIEEYANELLANQTSGKYSPIEVADWLEQMADEANRAIVSAGKMIGRKTPVFRRVEEDVYIQIGLGRFFAEQIRSAVFFELYLATGDLAARERALSAYEQARDAWAKMAARANGVYKSDVTFGETAVRRGHWSDRIPAIDWDLEVMRAFSRERARDASDAIRLALERSPRTSLTCDHTPPERFTPGREITLTCRLSDDISARLFYRHVDQAERWETINLMRNDVTIPADYTKTSFAIQYYFELRKRDKPASLYPGLGPDLANQPYFVVSQERS